MATCPRHFVFALATALALTPLPSSFAGDPPDMLLVERRHVAQQGGTWTLRYTIRYLGTHALEIAADQITVEYNGTVSNSRCAGHALARPSQARLSAADSLAAKCTVIESSDSWDRCEELIEIALKPPERAILLAASSDSSSGAIQLWPSEALDMLVRLSHEHPASGNHDPLLGPRRLVLKLGHLVVEDEPRLDRLQHDTVLDRVRLEPAEDRLDTKTYYSAPGSLVLRRPAPRTCAYRFPGTPVRPGSTVRIGFWYRTTGAGDEPCRVCVTEYCDSSRRWTRLEGGFDAALPARGEWTHFQRHLTTGPRANTLTIEFLLAGQDRGEAWIDDVEIVPEIQSVQP